MQPHDADKRFSSSVAEIYNSHFVPLIFEPYAADMAQRVVARRPLRVLEVAAGTGVVTRALARQLPPDARLVATDLNQAMLDRAMQTGAARDVEWRQADALALPFEEACFDAVVCQFGAMFFPDKARAFAEARRVLAPGGALLFSVWDRIEDNEFADCVTRALAARFPDDPPRFMARTPHGYHDPALLRRDLVAGGFTADASITPLAERSRAASSQIVAFAYCQGSPLRDEIEARDADGLADATAACAAAVAERFGHGAVDGKIQAQVVVVER
jgi:SAM-dependent methyltransferase